VLLHRLGTKSSQVSIKGAAQMSDTVTYHVRLLEVISFRISKPKVTNCPTTRLEQSVQQIVDSKLSDCWVLALNTCVFQFFFVRHPVLAYRSQRVAPAHPPPHTCTPKRHFFSWLGGVVVSALRMRTRRPRFESRVEPLFH